MADRTPIFIGENELHFNQATLCKIIEAYLFEKMSYSAQAPRVTKVAMNSGSPKTFVVTLDSDPAPT